MKPASNSRSNSTFQLRACGVFDRVIDKPVEAVLLPPRHEVSLRREQLVFRVLRQPLISGLLLSWELLPLRADTLV